MSTETPTINAAFPTEQIAENKTDQFVRVRVGELELVMGTEHLSGVFQVSRQHRLTEDNTILTPKGEFPVVSMSEVLQQRLNLKPESFEGKALIAVESDGQISMVRADSVSRPAVIKPEHIHPMPRVANSGDKAGLIRSIVNVAPSSDNPNDSIRLLFDPRVALGQTVPAKAGDEPNPLPKEAASAIAATAAVTARQNANGSRKSGQLLAFIPEDVSRSEVEHVFCLPLTAVAEVITKQRNLNAAITSEVFDGFVLWRKVPVPIVRLGKIFGFGSDDTVKESRRLVIARATGNRFIGFYAQPQMQTMKVPQAIPGGGNSLAGRPHRGCFRTELGELVVPDMNRILDNDF